MAQLRSMNICHIIGYLSQDVKFKRVKVKRKGKDKEENMGMASFNIATNETFGPDDKRVEFHRIVMWGKRAEFCNKYLKKGSFIGITGKLRHRSFTGDDGIRRWITEIHADDVTFLGKKEDYEVKEEPEDEEQPKSDPF